ncbi:MAG: DUF4114 domain-containing protein [Cyanobacteria bacterium P01_D01_bin.56]
MPAAINRVGAQNNGVPNANGELIFRIRFNDIVDASTVNVDDFRVVGGSSATVQRLEANNGERVDVVVSGGDLGSFTGDVGILFAETPTITTVSDGSTTPDTRLPLERNFSVVRLENGTPTAESPTTVAPANIVNITTTPPPPTDDTAPIVESITPQGNNPTDADQLVFRVDFSEDIQNLDNADFVVTGGSTAGITNIALVDANNNTYDITVSGGNLADFNGSVGIDLAANQNITDLANNALSGVLANVNGQVTVNNNSNNSNNNGNNGNNGNNTPPLPPANGTLNPSEDVLGLTLGDSQLLKFNIADTGLTSVGDITIFKTDINGNNRTQLEQFSVLEGGLLPAGYNPMFTLTDSEIATGDFIQFEITEKGVTSIATLNAVSNTEVSLDFGGGTKLTALLADETAFPTDQVTNGAQALDFTGTGTSNVKFTVYREAALDSTVGFYTTDTADGGIIVDQITGAIVRPGEQGYAAAVETKTLDIQLTGQNEQTNMFDATINNGGFVGMFVQVNTAQEQIFYSFEGANGGVDHFRQIGTNAFGIEDLPGGGDRDYNDMVVQFEVTSTTV